MKMACTPLHLVWDKVREKTQQHWKDIQEKESFPSYFEVDWNYYLSASMQGQAYAVTAWEGRNLVGYAAFMVTEEPQHVGTFTAALQTCWVDQEHRGLGHRLMKLAVEEMFKLGAHRVVSEVEGERLGRLMKKLGFKPVRTVWQKESENGRS